MKLIKKTSIALIIALFVFISCKDDKKNVVQNINPIIILSKGVDSCDLKLSDNGETKTHGNMLIRWKCGTGVNEIVDIFHKSGDFVLVFGPQKQNPNIPNSDWIAVTKTTSDTIIEYYGIKWKNSNDSICNLDPLIKVDPQ